MDLTSKQNVSGLKGFNQGTLVNRTYDLNPTAIRRDAGALTMWSNTSSMVIIEIDDTVKRDGWMKIKIHQGYVNVAHYLELGLYSSGYNATYINNTTNADVINMVRWGYNANGKLCIILNDGTLNLFYPEIYVEEFHYSNADAVNNPIVMSFTTDISGFTNLQTFPLSHRNAATATSATSATKLQTARTIAGVSFDGTANIDIPFANLSSKPTTLGGYGITDAVTLNTAQTVTGSKTFNGTLTSQMGRTFNPGAITKTIGNIHLRPGVTTND